MTSKSKVPQLACGKATWTVETYAPEPTYQTECRLRALAKLCRSGVPFRDQW